MNTNKLIINKNIKKESSSSNNYYVGYKYIISILNNNNYKNILYIIKDKGFTYSREIQNNLCITSTFYLNKLMGNKIIKLYQPTEQELYLIKLLQHNINDSQIKHMKFYCLAPHIKLILEQELIKPLFYDGLSDTALELKSNQLQRFNILLQEIQAKKEHEDRLFKIKCKNMGIICQTEDDNTSLY